MKGPFISICIPAYQKTDYLRRLLDSIAVQTFTDHEIIISDDSADESVKKLIEEFRALKINYTRNIPAAGMPSNWNLALLKAKGEWIKLMHDDDWFSADTALQQFASEAKNTPHSFIFSACNNIYATGKEVHEHLSPWKKKLLDEDPVNLSYRNVIGHPSTVMHRRDEQLLYDTRFQWVVDIDFYIRYLKKYPGYHYIPQMLVNIGTDDKQLSQQLYKNPRVEVPEYLAMLAKYPSNLMWEHEAVFHCVWDLVRRFRIGHIGMIEELGYQGPLPDHIQSIIDFQRPIPRLVIKQSRWSKRLMQKCYRKLKP
ncbi:MAG: glycosyltransferase [Chitinophagaceae bacterium]|nr:glycosyltransferase [Chitinophagaceae bacterium]